MDEMYKSETTLGEKVDKLTELVEQGSVNKKKEKKFRLPFKGKLSKTRLRQGYVTILEIGENDNADFTRQPIIDGTIKLGDTFHAVDDSDTLIYKGKPFLIIPKKSSVPYNPNCVDNNTFGQKHIMSRMMNETLDKAKKIGMMGISIGVLILGGVVIYALIAG